MTVTTKIICPKCGTEMNHHAVKIEYGSEESINNDFDGLLKNVHTCPHCGDVEMSAAE